MNIGEHFRDFLGAKTALRCVCPQAAVLLAISANCGEECDYGVAGRDGDRKLVSPKGCALVLN